MGIRTAPEVLDKTEDEVLIKTISFASADLADGETIASIDSVTVSPGGELTIDDQAFSGSEVQLTLSAGLVDGDSNGDYTITLLVTTTEGQTLEAAVRMIVRAP